MNEDFNCDYDSIYSKYRLSTMLFGMAGFKDVIKDTLKQDLVIQNMRKDRSIQGMSRQSLDNTLSNVLYSQFMYAYSNTQTMFQLMNSVRNHYIVSAIIDTMLQDSLAADPLTGNIFTLTVKDTYSKSDKANRELKKFEESHNLDELVYDSAADLIFFGEYFYELAGKPGKGITDIIDANPPGSMLSIYQGSRPDYFVRIHKQLGYGTSAKLERLEPGAVWHMNIFPEKIHFSLNNSYWDQFNNKSAQYFKIGKPMFYPVFDKIIELEAFEKAQLAKSFSDLRRKGLVGVDAPAGLDLAQIKTFRQYYEKIINNSGEVDLAKITGLDQVKKLVLNLGELKVVPIQPDRGGMNPIQLRETAGAETSENITDRRKVICQTTGVPYEYVFDRGDENKVSVRQYIRYSRKCGNVQYGTSRSLQRLVLTHMYNLGDDYKDLKEEDIDVKFYNSINVAELDKLEFMDAEVSMLNNMNRFIDDLARDEESKKFISIKEKMRYMSRVFSSIEGAENIIQVPDDEKEGEAKNA